MVWASVERTEMNETYAITITADTLASIQRKMAEGAGRAIVLPVRVNWPELALTESQRLENAIWATEPHRTTERPHRDKQLIEVIFQM